MFRACRAGPSVAPTTGSAMPSATSVPDAETSCTSSPRVTLAVQMSARSIAGGRFASRSGVAPTSWAAMQQRASYFPAQGWRSALRIHARSAAIASESLCAGR